MKDFSEHFWENPMSLPQEVLLVLDRFEKENIEAFVVGGSVRDHLLKRLVEDFDLATAALPQKVLELFCDMKPVPTGIKHGTVTVISGGFPIEITTFRSDGEYKDNRHPESVAFSNSLNEDLSRRDFTVNAICYSPKTGFFDPFGGMSDIKDKIIRAVGEPKKRFEEDALRILRGLRFAAVLGFDIEEETKKALYDTAPLLKSISKERVFSEFKKLLMGDSGAEILNKYFCVLREGVSSLQGISLNHPDFSRLGKIKADSILRLCGFAVSLNQGADFIKALLKELKSDNKTLTSAEAVLNGFYLPTPKTDYDIKCFLNRFGTENTKRIFSLYLVFGKISKSEETGLSDSLTRILEEEECYDLSSLCLSGKDVLALGVNQKDVGRILDAALQKVMRGDIKNSRAELVEFIKNFCNIF